MLALPPVRQAANSREQSHRVNTVLSVGGNAVSYFWDLLLGLPGCSGMFWCFGKTPPEMSDRRIFIFAFCVLVAYPFTSLQNQWLDRLEVEP